MKSVMLRYLAVVGTRKGRNEVTVETVKIERIIGPSARDCLSLLTAWNAEGARAALDPDANCNWWMYAPLTTECLSGAPVAEPRRNWVAATCRGIQYLHESLAGDAPASPGRSET